VGYPSRADEFVFTGHPARIVFGAGSVREVGAEVERLGRRRALLVTGPALGAVANRVKQLLGQVCVGHFDGAAMHTPVEVTDAALQLLVSRDADCAVAVGGGSATGLAKALAARTDVDLVVLPTTYAGSEVTPVLGETANGQKTTRSTPMVLPETVIYDVELSRNLPAHLAIPSALNALAHAVEALYAKESNPIVDHWALESARALAAGLRGFTDQPHAIAVRTDLLRGAWLAGMCLGSVGMALHHKVCHVLGGAFGLPHAETHAVVLPHAMAFNAIAAPGVMAAMDVEDAPGGVWELGAQLGAPSSLSSLGLRAEDLDRVAELVAQASYPNPRPVTESEIRTLLEHAWDGSRPAP